MTTLIANEFRKLRTIGGPWLLLAAGPVLVIVGVAGAVAGGADLTQPQTAIHAVAHAGLMSLLTLVFGITAVAGEYRHKTITDTHRATPSGGRERPQVPPLPRRRWRLRPHARHHRGHRHRRGHYRQRRLAGPVQQRPVAP